jgi:hypothetical protein
VQAPTLVKRILNMFILLTRVLRECHKSVTGVLQECYRSVTGRHNNVTSVTHHFGEFICRPTLIKRILNIFILFSNTPNVL